MSPKTPKTDATQDANDVQDAQERRRQRRSTPTPLKISKTDVLQDAKEPKIDAAKDA
jgi:hypothetical protein